MKGSVLGTIVGLACITAVAACATGARMSADESIKARQQLMKEQGAAFGAIQKKAKSGQIQAIAADAQKLVMTAQRIPSLFPEGSLNPQVSRAKPEIWQKWSQFTGYAKTLESKATRLAAIAQKGDAQATNAAISDLGKSACVACHDTFRGPEIKKG
jgi:cytochrome c556